MYGVSSSDLALCNRVSFSLSFSRKEEEMMIEEYCRVFFSGGVS